MSALPTDDTDPDASLELVEVLKPLRQVHGVATTYGRLWGAAVNGAFPARRVGRRWHVRRGDLPLIVDRPRVCTPIGTSKPLNCNGRGGSF
jgi:hypothetical protein